MGTPESRGDKEETENHDHEQVIATIEARYQDGRKAKMTARVAINRVAEGSL